MRNFHITFFLLFSLTLLAQNSNYSKNTSELTFLKSQLTAERAKKEKRVEKYLSKHPELSRSFNSGDNEMSLIDVRKGQPIYYITYNDGSARSLGVYDLREGGKFGIDLAGENINMGVWDRGLPLASHREFQGRLQNSDAASEFSFHSTHVTGTLLAGGVSTNAKGFCYRGTARAFDWFQDTEEMIDEILNNDIMVSNHSYGVPGGWNGSNWFGDPGISTEEDYRFGFYDDEAQAFDQIAYNAPYYSIVTAAGNERGDSGDGTYPPDGPYDCITGFSTAKNVFTVGAVEKLSSTYSGPEDVVMSSFSSWGPLDDGRIKPDFCAPGVSLYSSSNASESAYDFSSGTSMASPSAAGVVALINEAYQLYNGVLLRSASLKALLIHTAHEAGNSVGPDYSFGWGMISADKAVDFIQNIDGVNQQIIESTLSQGEVFELSLNPQQGEKITATLVWNDPAGEIPARSLDPTDLMLVNDLDMSIDDLSGIVAQPWILDPASSSAPARRGDNFRDNVEKIEFEMPDAKPYTLRIRHKSTLTNGTQDFSLVLEYSSEDSGISNIFWIDDSGSWSDGTQWSLNSGGGASNMIPNENSKVIIDDNSISGTSADITLQNDVTVASLVAFTDKKVNIDLGGYNLTVLSTVNFASSNFSFSNGTITCLNTDEEVKNILNFDETVFEDVEIVWPAANKASWTIMNGSFAPTNLLHRGGHLYLENCRVFASTLELDSDLILKNSVFYPESSLSVLQDCVLSEMGVNRIQIEDVDNVFVSITGVENKFEFNLLNASVSLNTNVDLESVNVDNSRLSIVENVNIVNLVMSNDSELLLESGKLLSCQFVEMTSDNQSSIRIESSVDGEKAFFELLDRNKFCFENLIILNVDLVGSGVASVGEGSQLENSEGWFVGSCSDLLFADFEAEYLCEGALAKFEDLSDGNVSQWYWSVDGELIYWGRDFEHYFESGGEYEVGLQIMDGQGNADEWTKTISISSSTIPSNTIFKNATQLLSTNQASAYQWYNYGGAISGAVERSYLYNGAPGIYWVLTFEGDCNRRSDILDLSTRIIDLDKENNLIKVVSNPVHSNLELEWLKDIGEVEIVLLDLRGKRIFEKSHVQTLSSSRIELEHIPSGNYILSIRNKQNTYVKKIIKAN